MARRPISNKTSISIRTLASAYILYLAFQLIRDFDQVPANQKIGIGLAIVAFIAAPIWFLTSAYREWKLIKARETEEAAEQAAQPALEPESFEEPEDETDEAARLAEIERLAEEGRVEELERAVRELEGRPEDKP